MKNVYYLNQKVLFETVLFGKTYWWMEDPEGTLFLAKVVDGVPQFNE